MERTRRSLLFSFAEKYTALLLATAGSMLIARVLTPAEIGIYAIGAVLAGLAQVLRDFGVGQYLVAARELTREQLRAALAVSLTAGWSLALLVAAASSPLAAFYGQPRLHQVLLLLSLNFLMVPISSMTLAWLRRHMQWRAVYCINSSHALTQFGLSVGLSLLGYGCVGLALATVGAGVAGLLVSLLFRPAELPWLPRWRGAGAVLQFGAYAAGGNIIDEAGMAAPDLIVGKLLGSAEVAIFGKAQSLLNLFAYGISSAVSPVLLPLFAAQAREGSDLRASYLTTVSCITALSWPFFSLLAILALPVIRLLYGAQWDGAAPLVRIMCCSAAVFSMFNMARYLFVATGHVREQARLDAWSVALRIGALLPAALAGLEWVAVAVAFGAVGRSWLTWRCLQHLAGLQARAMGAAVWRSAVLAGACALPALAALMLVPGGAAQLLAGGGGAALAWLAGILLLRHPLAKELPRLSLRRPVRGIAE
ncbi:oligosaccharide flippase family protein [Massilia endophytica]|uniref:oligosaccharide flippase family protein n=1 Tax=Massilia endophytica TaxID=2899220 RepID=UPI001E2BDB08|nr:oligosaccharide flippase family protein [Massilia endophytica]UGQ48548.1 oligosaccharide flippase family protein [Massilia endophytica]